MKFAFTCTALLAVLSFVADADTINDRPVLKLVVKDRRGLQSLNFRGSDPSFQLGQCQGDCDDNGDCQGSLVCYEKDSGGSGFVPGCSGQDTSRNDYCIDPADLNAPPSGPPPTPPTGPSPTTAPAPTGNPPTPAPVQAPTGNPPTPPGSSEALFNFGPDPPSDVLPLGVCEGDCDSDSDCEGNLSCLQRERNAGAVPGCTGNDSSQTDYCVSPSGSPSPPVSPPVSPPTQVSSSLQNFKLKLYWEEGYYWQEETFERKWCMRCRNGSCSLNNKLYIEECDDSGVQRFDFDYVNNDEVLIKLHGTNHCLERQNRDIFIKNCDQGKSLQRWWAKVGEFDEDRFEISQFGATNLCVTQRHHPKPDEEVELEPCTTARNGETSFWERCYSNSC